MATKSPSARIDLLSQSRGSIEQVAAKIPRRVLEDQGSGRPDLGQLGMIVLELRDAAHRRSTLLPRMMQSGPSRLRNVLVNLKFKPQDFGFDNMDEAVHVFWYAIRQVGLLAKEQSLRTFESSLVGFVVEAFALRQMATRFLGDAAKVLAELQFSKNITDPFGNPIPTGVKFGPPEILGDIRLNGKLYADFAVVARGELNGRVFMVELLWVEVKTPGALPKVYAQIGKQRARLTMLDPDAKLTYMTYDPRSCRPTSSTQVVAVGDIVSDVKLTKRYAASPGAQPGLRTTMLRTGPVQFEIVPFDVPMRLVWDIVIGVTSVPALRE